MIKFNEKWNTGDQRIKILYNFVSTFEVTQTLSVPHRIMSQLFDIVYKAVEMGKDDVFGPLGMTEDEAIEWSLHKLYLIVRDFEPDFDKKFGSNIEDEVKRRPYYALNLSQPQVDKMAHQILEKAPAVISKQIRTKFGALI